MSVTPLFCLSLRSFRRLGPVACLVVFPNFSWSQAVPSQANTDSSAQRRLQEAGREAQRQNRINREIRKLSPALSADQLAGSMGPVLARKALAAMIRLRDEGISPDESLASAARSAELSGNAASRPSAYLRNLFSEYSPNITSSVLARLEAGEDPAPAFTLPRFKP